MNKIIKMTLILSCLTLCNFNLQLFAQDKDARLAEAQKNLEEATREYAELATELGGENMQHIVKSFSFDDDSKHNNKARLGINIGEVKIREMENGKELHTEKRGAEDTGDGVKILGVSPNGPAEKAGLKSGDLITSLNGKALVTNKDNTAIKQLTDIMSAVKPGDSVELLYQREGVSKSNTIVTDAMPKRHNKSKIKILLGDKGMNFDKDIDINIQEMDGLQGLEGLANLEIFEGMGDVLKDSNFIFISNSPLGNAELVELSPELGEYFGAKSGLLVVKAPTADIDLRDGDVILSIDGREPATVSHAMRILRSYETGEEVKLEILRKKRKRKLNLTIPEASDSANTFKWKFDHNSDDSAPVEIEKRIKVVKEKETT